MENRCYIATYIYRVNPSSSIVDTDSNEAVLMKDEHGHTLFGKTRHEMMSLCRIDATKNINNSDLKVRISESDDSLIVYDAEDFAIYTYNIHEI